MTPEQISQKEEQLGEAYMVAWSKSAQAGCVTSAVSLESHVNSSTSLNIDFPICQSEEYRSNAETPSSTVADPMGSQRM